VAVHVERTVAGQQPLEPSDSPKCKPAGTKDSPSHLLYTINDSPPWYLKLLLAFQHYIVMFCPTLPIPYLIADVMCVDVDDPVRASFISTILFVSGIASVVQIQLGVRLPILQGCSTAYLLPAFAVLSLPQWKCNAKNALDSLHGTPFNNTSLPLFGESHGFEEVTWQHRMREIQGTIMAASLFEMVLGYCGVIGFLQRFFTPMVITTTITLLGLSMFEETAKMCASNWGISTLTILLLIIFVQYMSDVQVPMLMYSKTNGLQIKSWPAFKLFSVMSAMVIVWILSIILTLTNVLPANNPARTYIKLSIISDSPWVRIPYPGQWGTPSISLVGVLGMTAAMFVSVVESVGDYYACARVSGAPPPPVFAINRGIGTEGVGVFLAGLWGTGCGTTSLSQNIAAITLTRVGSRSVMMYTAVLMIVFGVFTKFGALFAIIPEPIVGGMFCVMTATITSVGLSSIQFLDLNSPRNLFILGLSIMVGFMLPQWVKANTLSINTGNITVDQVIVVLLGSSMFVGGFLSTVLDNTVPGSREERGLISWTHQTVEQASLTCGPSCYNLPFSFNILDKKKLAKYFPWCAQVESQNTSSSQSYCSSKRNSITNSV
jgi:nucleobase transporter 1/2